MSDIIRRAAKGFVPAGYLPAPQQARFISTAEEAAKRLPASIKAQSVQNQLQKFGAKPLELEYAGLGRFLEGKDRVSSQEVLQHLQQQGPLGQLKRVDQGDAQEPGDADLEFEPNPNEGEGGYVPKMQDEANFYQSSVRAPFGSDAKGSYPHAGYGSYTAPGRQFDFTGYRESLIEDPRATNVQRPYGMLPQPNPDKIDSLNERARLFDESESGATLGDVLAMEQEAERAGYEFHYAADGTPYFKPQAVYSALNAHQSDYWLRYNNLPDRIAIQNVQSDIGQKASAAPDRNKLLAQLDRSDAMLEDFKARHPRLAYSLSPHVDDPLFDELLEAGPAYYGYTQDQVDEYTRLFAESEKRVNALNEADRAGDWNTSPLARDNNWKNLLLRHALLESVNQGGKPITLPTGRQMVDVEQFGRHQAVDAIAKQGIPKDDPRFSAAVERLQIEKANALNEDHASRLMKILKEIHPKGGTLERYAPPEPHGIHETRPLDWGTVDDQDKDFYRSVLNSLPPATDETPIVLAGDPGVHYAIRAIASGDGSKSDWKRLYGVVEGTPAWGGDVASPQYREAALKMVQYKQLMREMGLEFPPPTPDPDEPGRDILDGPEEATSPGWTITPHPETVRAALQKGVPIMSLAPLLLAPQEEQQ